MGSDQGRTVECENGRAGSPGGEPPARPSQQRLVLSDLRDSVTADARNIMLWLGAVSDGDHISCSFAAAPAAAAYSESLGLVCSK